MIETFCYVSALSLKNRTLSKFRRLREPQYLIAAIFGVAYVAWFFVNGLLEGIMSGGSNTEAELKLLTLVFSGFVYFALILPWAFPSSGAGMVFSEPEIEFLFAAPLTRNEILLFKVFRSQPKLLFTTAMIWVFMTGGSGNFIGIWTSVVTLHLYLILVSFARARLKLAGIGLVPRLLAVATVLAGSGLWLVWSLGPLRGPLTSAMTSGATKDAFFGKLTTVLLDGPGLVVTWFPSLFASPFFATGPIETTFRCGVLVILGFAFFLVTARLDVSFEDASIEASKRNAERVRARRAHRTGTSVRFTRVPSLFPLAERGRPEMAIVWKNMVAATRMVIPILAIVIVATLLFPLATGILADRESAYTLLLLLGSVGLGIVTMAGALFFRVDLRKDLRHLVTLKLLPLSGRDVVLAEASSTLALMIVTQLVFGTMALSGLFAILTPDEANQVVRWLPMALVLIIPFNALQILVQNGAALAIPAWVIHRPEESSGIEVIGKSIALFIGHVLSLTLALVPAAVLFGVTFAIATLVVGMSSDAGAIASVPAALLILGECWFVVHLLGRRFERMQPTDLDLD